MMTDKYFPFAKSPAISISLLQKVQRMRYDVTMGAHKVSKTLRNTFEVNPKTGQIGGVGRSCALPKTSERGAY
jgi:hypothetical protein